MTATDASSAITEAAQQAGLKVEFTPRPERAICFVFYISKEGNDLSLSGLRARAKKMSALLAHKGLSLGALQNNSGYKSPMLCTRVWFG